MNIQKLLREYRKRKKDIQWKLLIWKNPRKESYPNYMGQDYDRPNYALQILRDAQKVNEHYGAVKPPKINPGPPNPARDFGPWGA